LLNNFEDLGQIKPDRPKRKVKEEPEEEEELTVHIWDPFVELNAPVPYPEEETPESVFEWVCALEENEDTSELLRLHLSSIKRTYEALERFCHIEGRQLTMNVTETRLFIIDELQNIIQRRTVNMPARTQYVLLSVAAAWLGLISIQDTQSDSSESSGGGLTGLWDL
jgi:hypothetical protein